MAAKKIIRKNTKTNKWEHLVPRQKDDTHAESHWAPGLYGNDEQDVKEIYDTNIELLNNGIYQLYNDLTTEPISALVFKEWINNESYSDIIDTSFPELIPELGDTNIGLPIFTKRPFDNEPINFVIKEGKYIIYIIQDYKLLMTAKGEDPLTLASSSLEFNWNKNGTSKLLINGKEETKYLFNGNKIDEGIWDCTLSNKQGSISSEPFQIKVKNIDESGLFYTNLIKNHNFKDDLNNWEVIEGRPEVRPEWEAISGVGSISENAFKYISWNDDPIEHNYELHKRKEWQVGPELHEIFIDRAKTKLNNFHYCMGGVVHDEKDYISRIKQEIDITNISDWIDGKINGVDGVYGNLFGWLSNYGTNPNGKLMTDLNKGLFYNIPNNRKDGDNMFKPWMKYDTKHDLVFNQTKEDLIWLYQYHNQPLTCGDRVIINLNLYDKSHSVIESNYRIVNPLHNINDSKFFVRQQYVYIPIGTRYIEVEIVFQKQRFYKRSFKSKLKWEGGSEIKNFGTKVEIFNEKLRILSENNDITNIDEEDAIDQWFVPDQFDNFEKKWVQVHNTAVTELQLLLYPNAERTIFNNPIYPNTDIDLYYEQFNPMNKSRGFVISNLPDYDRYTDHAYGQTTFGYGRSAAEHFAPLVLLIKDIIFKLYDDAYQSDGVARTYSEESSQQENINGISQENIDSAKTVSDIIEQNELLKNERIKNIFNHYGVDTSDTQTFKSAVIAYIKKRLEQNVWVRHRFLDDKRFIDDTKSLVDILISITISNEEISSDNKKAKGLMDYYNTLQPVLMVYDKNPNDEYSSAEIAKLDEANIEITEQTKEYLNDDRHMIGDLEGEYSERELAFLNAANNETNTQTYSESELARIQAMKDILEGKK